MLTISSRDDEILDSLTLRVRLLTLDQVARCWWADAKSARQLALNRLRELELANKVHRFDLHAHPELPLTEPEVIWKPKAPIPDFHRLSYRLSSRRKQPPILHLRVIATHASGRHYGGWGGRKPRSTERTHDLHMAAVFLLKRARDPESVVHWMSEEKVREHLPPPEQYRDMELAFKEDYFHPPEFSRRHLWPYLKYTAILVLLLAGYLALVAKLILLVTAVLFFFLPTLFVRPSILRSDYNIQLTVACVMLLLLGGMFFVADSFQNARQVFLAFAAILLVVLWLVGRDFFEFFAQWLYAHPCLRSEERRQLLRGMAYPGLHLLPAGLTLLVLFASHVFPPFPILMAVYGVLIVFLIRGPLFDTGPTGSGQGLVPVFKSLNRYLAAYLSYGRRFQKPLPGVWNPKRYFLTRQRIAALTLLLLLFILGLGTKCFFAWDTPGFRAAYEGMFARSIHGDSGAWTELQKRMAGLDWSSIPSRAELDQMNRKLAELQSQQRWGTLDQQIAREHAVIDLQSRLDHAPAAIRQVSELWFNQHANGCIIVAFKNLAAAPGPVLSSLAFAICNALLLPILFLLVANQRAFVALIRAERDLQVRIMKDAGRNPWECYVDRVRNSPHKAEDPVQAGATIRESEHVFLGLEAEHGFPVLLHRPILEGHAYIAGGTGSGKTSLGILSLLVQLIRGGPADGADEGKMPPIVIIDLKGEHALLHSVREEVRKKAEQEGRTLQDCFRLFSCAKGMPTQYFNPISDMTHPDRYVADLTNVRREGRRTSWSMSFRSWLAPVSVSFWSKRGASGCRQFFPTSVLPICVLGITIFRVLSIKILASSSFSRSRIHVR